MNRLISNNTVTVIFFLTIFPTVIFAGSPLLDKFHGDTLATCNIGAMCSKENKASCISLHRSAFEKCDPLFYKYPKSSHKFASCIAMATTSGLTKIMQGIDYMKCNNLPKEIYKSEATNPIDHPQKLEYFTDNSLDFYNLQLYGSGSDACKAGLNRLKKLSEEKGDSRVDFNITKVDVSNYSGGSEYHTHIFSTPGYKVGDCFGTTKTTVLKSNGVFKKGEVILGKFSERIFVAVQCHKEPLHASCINEIRERESEREKEKGTDSVD